MGNNASRQRARTKSNPETNDINDTQNDVDELSQDSLDKLNATKLRFKDVICIRACAAAEGIHNGLMIVASQQTNDSVKFNPTNITYISSQTKLYLDLENNTCFELIIYHLQRDDMILCEKKTHKEIKDWTSLAIKTLKKHQLLSKTISKYDGIIYVPLCIVKVQLIENTKTCKYYYDSTGAAKHVDKLKKDIVYRLDDKMGFYNHWDTAIVNSVVIPDGQRLDPKHYSTEQVKKIKQVMRQIEDAVYGFCREHNQNVMLHSSILDLILYYRMQLWQDLPQEVENHDLPQEEDMPKKDQQHKPKTSH